MRLIQAWMNSFKSILSIKSLIKSTVDQVWLSVDFSRVLHAWSISAEFQTLIPWELDFKWCLKMYELVIIDHDAQILQEWPSSIALTDCWLSLTYLLIIASTASNKVRLTIFLYFLNDKHMKAKIYKCKVCLVIKKTTHKANHPLRGKQRHALILEVMIWMIWAMRDLRAQNWGLTDAPI